MDAREFDGFVRRLASSASRRRVLGVLLAAGLGGSTRLLERQSAEARCRPRNRKCGGICCPRGTFCRVPETQQCVSLRDTCEVGENFCAGGSEEARCGCGSGTCTCFCLRTLDKKTRCGSIVGPCGGCTRDGQCTTLFGRGAFCARAETSSCASCAQNEGACAQPCVS